jgi:tetratricopeptide (TPR) repeat protein
MKIENRRDTFVILSVLIIFAAGYFIVKSFTGGEPPARQPEQTSMTAAMNDLGDLPHNYDSLVTLGNEFMNQFNYPIAAECYRRALAIDSSSLDVMSDYGSCLHGMGLVGRAKEVFAKVLAKNPEHPIANYNMGIVYYDLEKPDSARYYWKKFLTLEPEGQAADAIREFMKNMDS